MKRLLPLLALLLASHAFGATTAVKVPATSTVDGSPRSTSITGDTTADNGKAIVVCNSNTVGLCLVLPAAASHTHTSASVTDFTEAAQDATGAMVADTATVDCNYVDATPSLSCAVINPLVGDLTGTASLATASTTAAANDNDTSIATTAFVQQEIDDDDNLSDNCAVGNDSTPIPDSCVGDGSDASGAPTTSDYLVGTADAGLSAEIVVGTSPGGELGGTWPVPTIDDGLAVTNWNLTTPTVTTDITIPNTGLHVFDTDASHDLIFKPGSNLTADKTLTITTGDADRSLTLPVDAQPARVFVGTGGDTAINSVTDVTVATRDVVSVIAGDQIVFEGEFIIFNDSGANRAYIVTMDFDGLYDIECTTSALVFNTVSHPMHFRAAMNVRSTSLSYATFVLEMELAAGRASGEDSTVAQTHQRCAGWGTSATDATGTSTVSLKMRSGSATATQTARLVDATIDHNRPFAP